MCSLSLFLNHNNLANSNSTDTIIIIIIHTTTINKTGKKSRPRLQNFRISNKQTN